MLKMLSQNFYRTARLGTFAFCLFTFALFLSCSSKPTDLRTLVPAETLVYLETNDLAAALQPIVDSKPFNEVAKSKPDLSALKGVQLAIAVTGFETSEEKLTDEHSVGRVQPHFVAVADTHAWQFQTVRFAEQKLGSFVAEMYDSEPTLEKSEKGGGHYLVWTAKDGRKAFAVVSRSLIYFSNDETAIEKCLAVGRGEADSIAKTGKVQNASQETLASGYVSTDGIAQIANIVGLKFASEAGEDSEVQSAIAGILPQLLRNSITEISWTATKTDEGIEDKYVVGMPADMANVFNETMAPAEGCEARRFDRLPDDVANATCYNFRNIQVAWRSLLLAGQKQFDPAIAKAIVPFTQLLFEPYGIKDPEKFFAAGNSRPVTANFSMEGDSPLVISSYIDEGKMYESLSADVVKMLKDGSGLNANGDVAAFQIDVIYIGGDPDAVKRLDPRIKEAKPSLASTITRNFDKNAVAVTVGHELNSEYSSLINLLAMPSDASPQRMSYFTETRFTKTGMERRTVSDFGLIGSIIAQLAQD